MSHSKQSLPPSLSFSLPSETGTGRRVRERVKEESTKELPSKLWELGSKLSHTHSKTVLSRYFNYFVELDCLPEHPLKDYRGHPSPRPGTRLHAGNKVLSNQQKRCWALKWQRNELKREHKRGLTSCGTKRSISRKRVQEKSLKYSHPLQFHSAVVFFKYIH